MLSPWREFLTTFWWSFFFKSYFMHVMMSVTLCNNELRVYNLTSLRRIIFFNYVNRVCDCTHVIRPQQNYNMLYGWNLHEEYFFFCLSRLLGWVCPPYFQLSKTMLHIRTWTGIKILKSPRRYDQWIYMYLHSIGTGCRTFRETILFNRWEKVFVKFSIKIGF